MNYYFPPAHVAEPESQFGFFVKFYFASGIPAFGSYLLINDDKMFLGIVLGIISVCSFLYSIFGYHRCLSCYENRIPKSKKYCYECWQRAKQANNPELNKDILNPED